MNNSSFNYVRTHRRRYALSEEELSFLLNQRAQSAVAQFERGDRVPNFEGVLALQVLFRQQPREMFPGYYDWVEERVMRRVAKLLGELEGKKDRRSVAKREFLERVARPDNEEGA